MALFDKLFSLKRRLDSDNCEFKDRARSRQINSEQVRLLLFKECDWRGRKVLFDSSAIQKVPAGKHDKPNVRQDDLPCIVEVSDGYSYVYKGPEADASILGEMIFGAVAMNYKSVSLKIHIMDEPRRLMCTKVFCVPSRRMSRAERRQSDKTSSCANASTASTPLAVPSFKDDGVALSFSMDRGDSGFCDHSSYSSVGSTFDHLSIFDDWDGTSSQEDFYSFHSLPGRKLSTSSNGSWQRRTFQNIATRFDLGQNQQMLSVPTSRTSDSQTYSNSSASGTSDSIASGSLLPQRKNKLGIAVLITVTDAHQLDLVRACVEHSPQVQALVCRLRAAAILAAARGDFVAVLHRAADDAAIWLSDLIYGPRLQPLWLNMVTSDASVTNKLADRLLSDLCSILAVGDTKTTNFFISTLLTHVLTYHLGWVTTVSPYDTIDHQKVQPDDGIKKPYNALWAQLNDLCGSIGFPLRSSRTIISGEKNAPFVNRLLSVLTYFLRCGDVKRTVFEYQECVFKATKTVAVQGPESSRLKRTTTRVKKLVDCDIPVSVNTQNSYSEGTLVPSEVSLKTAVIADVTPKLSSSAESSSTGLKPTLGPLERNPTMMLSLKASSDSSLNSSVSEDSDVDQKVVFVLGDDEKLVGLKNKSTNGKCVKKSSKVHIEPVVLVTPKATCETEGCKDRDTESPSKCCGQTLQHSKPIKHSGFKFEFDKYPQIVTNYMKSKNLEILDRHYIGKPGNLKLDNFQFDPMVVPPIQEEKCDSCVKCQMMEVMLQTPTNASELEYMNDLPRQSEPQFAKETIVTDTERQHREVSPKTFVRTRKQNVVVVNLIKNIKVTTEDVPKAASEKLEESLVDVSNETEPKFVRDCSKLDPEISIRHTTSSENVLENSSIASPLRTKSKLTFTKSSNNLCSLLSLEDSYTDDPINKVLGHKGSEVNESHERPLSETLKNTQMASNEFNPLHFNNSTFSRSLKIHEEVKSNDLKSTQFRPDQMCKLKSTNFNSLSTSGLRNQKSNDPSLPVEFKTGPQDREWDRMIPRKAVSAEKERDRLIDVKTVTEFVSPELSAKTEICSQRSGYDGSLLGGVTDHYVPDLILQGTTAKPISFESELKRDLDITTYLNKQMDAPVKALAIVGDTNTWEVRVVGRDCGTGGMSSLVAAMLDALPAMWKARVPAHQCLSFLESKLREFCVLSKTLADMLMSTDFCDIATLTKSLNIDVNDVPLLLAVATTHTPQVATRYGISYR